MINRKLTEMQMDALTTEVDFGIKEDGSHSKIVTHRGATFVANKVGGYDHWIITTGTHIDPPVTIGIAI